MKKRIVFLLISVVIIVLTIIFAFKYKSGEQIATDAVNNIMQTDLFKSEEILFVEKTYSDEYNYGFAAEVIVDDTKFHKFLSDFCDDNYNEYAERCLRYEKRAQKIVPDKTFSKNISNADEIYRAMYPIYSNIELPKHHINKTSGRRSAFAILYVFKDNETNHICIRVVC